MKTPANSQAVNLELTARILTNGRNQTSKPRKEDSKKIIYTAILFLIPIVVAILTSF